MGFGLFRGNSVVFCDGGPGLCSGSACLAPTLREDRHLLNIMSPDRLLTQPLTRSLTTVSVIHTLFICESLYKYGCPFLPKFPVMVTRLLLLIALIILAAC